MLGDGSTQGGIYPLDRVNLINFLLFAVVLSFSLLLYLLPYNISSVSDNHYVGDDCDDSDSFAMIHG